MRWSRYWFKGVASFFGRPLRICPKCGAMYSGDGELLAAAAVQTEEEVRLDLYRRDMAYLRDSFGGVIVASEIAAIWLFAGAESVNVAAGILAASFGAAAFVPFGFFGSKVRSARKELKRLKQMRMQGRIPRR
ncbi:MAG: hypothetical protein AMS18_15615 [Gemmatimonas sp. SG8_17]|nr:MAG: hypothetical protein AMS18_15615 [Gemmatimonas sp. SG8_17]